MSLATRCPICSTVFRVVQDQLKVSEGWVRCGRCAKVFNAFEGLFDLERELAAMTPPTVSPAQRVLEDLAQRNRNPKPRTDWLADDDFDASSSVRVAGHPLPAPTSVEPIARAPARSPPASAPPSTTAPPPTRHWSTSRPAPLTEAPAPPSTPWSSSRPAALGEPAAAGPRAWTPSKPAPLPPIQAPTTAHRPAGKPVALAAPDDALALRAEPSPMTPAADAGDSGPSSGSYESLFRSTGELDAPTAHPSSIDIVLDGADSGSSGDAVDSRFLSFVQQAEKAERWRRPGVRAGLAALAAALALLLAIQLAMAERDLIASRWPDVRPLLAALCSPWNCRIEPLRRIDRLAVESSGLTRIADGQVYRLAMVLRNRSDTALLLPAVDLSLTDSGGALVSRRILSPTDLGAMRPTIPAGQEMPLQALLMSADRPLTGYTIEIFYP